MSGIIDYLFGLIETNSTDLLKEALGKINLSKITYEKGNELIKNLVSHTVKYGNKNSIIEIVKFVNDHDEDGQQLSDTICNIFMIPAVDEFDAKMILDAFPDISVFELFDSLTMKDSNSECKKAADFIVEFREIPNYILYTLYNGVKADQIMNGYSNKMIRTVLIREIEKNMEKSDSPEWIIDTPGDEINIDFNLVKKAYTRLPSAIDFSLLLMSYLQGLNINLYRMSNNGFDFVEERFDINMCDELFITLYAIADLEGRLELLKSIQIDIQIEPIILKMDKIIGNIYGPVNCGQLECGPCCCRMLSCFEYPRLKDILEDIDPMDDEEYNSEIIDWFDESCYFCHKKIRTRRHCLREPLPGGGWYGCFCSFECLNEHKMTTTSNILIEVRNLCFIKFEEKIRQMKIYRDFPEQLLN